MGSIDANLLLLHCQVGNISLRFLYLEQSLFLPTCNIKMNGNVLESSAASKLAICNFGISIILLIPLILFWSSLARET